MIEELKNLGLTYYESKALNTILREEITLKQLSKKAGIPFGKVYSIVNALVKKGLVQETDSRPKKVFVRNASETLAKLINEKQKEYEKIISEIKMVATEIDRVKKEKQTRFFQIGTTLEENEKIQLRSFLEAEKEVCQVLNIFHKPTINRKSKTIWEKEIENAVERGVVFRAIYPRNTILPRKLSKLNKKYPKLFQVRRLDTAFIRCDIIDRKKVLLKLSYEDPILFGGVIFIEDKRLAYNVQQIFEQMWENGERQ